MNVHANKQGFTIIEVVLVLAIAGLIFLMVFIALPALNRSQADNTRKSEVSSVAAAIKDFQSNNRTAPNANEAFAKYFDAKSDATGANANGTITMKSGTTVTKFTGSLPASISAANKDNMVFVIGGKCPETGGTNTIEKGTTKQAAVIIQLEQGDSYHCQTI